MSLTEGSARVYREPRVRNYNGQRAVLGIIPDRAADIDRVHELVVLHEEIPGLIQALQRAYDYEPPYKFRAPADGEGA